MARFLVSGCCYVMGNLLRNVFIAKRRRKEVFNYLITVTKF